MTAPVIAPNGDSPLNATLRLICWLLTVRIADLEHQVQAARQSCADEQADHQRTRLLLPPREERSDLRQVIADTAQSLAGIAEKRGAV